MFNLTEDWKKIIAQALKKSGIINESTKEISFMIIIGVKNNGLNYCEIKQKIK